MNQVNYRITKAVLLILLCAACASKMAKETSTDINEDKILNIALEDNGVINFFDNASVEKGLVIRNIKWRQPISSDNPGADCELKRRQSGPPTDVFACVVRESEKENVVLTLHEDIIKGDGPEAKRALKRITMDGKGVATLDRWEMTISKFGYKKDNSAKVKPGRSFWISPDKNTQLQIIWAADTNAVTLILDPAKSAN